MRVISADKQQILYTPARTERMRVEVKDVGSVWRDLTTYIPGFDAILSASWSENIDDPHVTAQVSARRELFKMSLSPLQSESALNRGFNPANAYAPLIALNREFRISVAVVPEDKTPVSGDWEIAFHGRIDRFNLADGDNIRFEGRDLGGMLANAYVEEERVYGLAAVGGNPVSCRIWKPSTVFPLNSYVVPTDAKRNVGGTPRFYKTTTSGTSASTEPVWPTAGTVADGSAIFTLQGATSPDVGFPVEKVVQNILDDWTPGITLFVPVTPVFDVTQYLQSRTNVLEAIRALALLYGGDIRYKWRTATAQFELTISDPDRTKTSIDYQFSDSDFEDIGSLASELSGIRNVWQGVYSDSADKDAGGQPKRKTLVVTDSTSINKYGRLFAEIAEEEASQIDSSAEMLRMLNGALADTKEPKIEQEIPLIHGFPWVELNDLMRFSANRYYSVAQDLAVFSYSHEATDGFFRTTISCRGQPSAGFDRWHNVSTQNDPEGARQLQLFESTGGVDFTAEAIPNGARLKVTASPDRRSLGEEYEFHVSSSASFTPSAATLVQRGKQRTCDVTNLVPGKVYYSQVVPYTHDNNSVVRGYPTTEVTFTAGYLLTRAMQPLVNINTLPVNCDFEANSDVILPPDKWTFSGTWGTHAQLRTDIWLSGGKCVQFNNNATSSHILASELMPVRREPNAKYRVRAWLYQSAASTLFTPYMRLQIRFYDNVFASVTTTGVIIINATVGGWFSIDLTVDMVNFTSFSTIAYASVEVYRDVSGGAGAHVFTIDRAEWKDETEITQMGWLTPTLLNSWVAFNSAVYNTAQYMKDSLGFVHLRGLVKNGTISTTLPIFTLPSAYRPALISLFAVDSNNAHGRCTIEPDGDVIPEVGNNAYFSLEGITFKSG